MGIPELNAQDLVCQRVTSDSQPASATGGVEPQLIVGTGGIVAQIDSLEESRGRIRGAGFRALELRITQVRKFIHVALAAERTSDSHVIHSRTHQQQMVGRCALHVESDCILVILCRWLTKLLRVMQWQLLCNNGSCT